MKAISRQFGVAIVFAVLCVGGFGCELITAVDREQIPTEVGSTTSGSTTGTTSSSTGGGQGGTGGAAGMGGSAGQGGNGGVGGVSTCGNGMKDGLETDVDCGGGDCPACGSGRSCLGGTDCLTGSCVGNVCVDVLLISEVRSRGTAGADDEFVEIYNPTSVSVTTDITWQLQVRSAVAGNCATTSYATRWYGSGQMIEPHGHLLIASTSYTQQPTPDASYAANQLAFPDAASIRLMRGSDVADAVCFHFDMATQTALATCSTPYTCEGASIANPHDNTNGTNTNASLERKPGGAQGSGTDTNNSEGDFGNIMPADPQNLSSAPTP